MSNCAQCSNPLDEEFWFTLVITEEDMITSGHFCSLDCLTDYVAEVHGRMLEDYGEDE